jgi:20S proteasome alpha/beta subunit
MTLIAAWKCKDGTVMCADSQETVGDYRRSVQKITPKEMGNFEVIVAGSGNPSLIESFIIVLERQVKKSKYTAVEEFEALAEHTLERFYRHDVHLCTDEDKTMQLFIAAVSNVKPYTYEVWVTENIRLRKIDPGCELIGWEKPLYSSIVKRFYHPDMETIQAFLAGIYLFALAETTSNYIGGPTSIAHIWPGGISMQYPEYIESTGRRLKDYEQKVNNIFLACADSSIHVHKLEEMLVEFSRDALLLHRHHLDQTINAMRLEDLMKANEALPKLPVGTVATLYGDGKIRMEHDPEVIKKKHEELGKLIKDTEEAIKKYRIIEPRDK